MFEKPLDPPLSGPGQDQARANIGAYSPLTTYLLPSRCPPTTYMTCKDMFSVADDWGHNQQSICVVPPLGALFALYPHHTDTARVYVARYRIDGVFVEGKAFDGVGHGQGLSCEVVGGELILWTGAGQYEDKIARLNFTTGAVTVFSLNLALAVPGWVSNSYPTPSLSPDGSEFVLRQVQAVGPNHMFFFRKTDVLANSLMAVPTLFWHDDPLLTTTRACQGVAHGGDVIYAQHGEQPTNPFKSRVLFAYERSTGRMIDRLSIRIGRYGAAADHQIIAADPAAEPPGSWRAGPEGISYAIDHRTGGRTLYYNNQSAYSYDKKVNRISAFDDDTVFRTKALTVERPIFPNNAGGVTDKPYRPVVKLLRVVYDGAKWVPWASYDGSPTPSGTAPSMFYQGVTRIYEDPADGKQKRIEDNNSGLSIILDETYGTLLNADLANDQSLNARGIFPCLYDLSTQENSVGQAHVTIVFNDVGKQMGADTASTLAANSARFVKGFDVKLKLIVGMPLEQTYLGPYDVDPDE
jgi:hypothetical protein